MIPQGCHDSHLGPLHLQGMPTPFFSAWQILLILQSSGQKRPLPPQPLHMVRQSFLLKPHVFVFSHLLPRSERTP